MIVEGGGVGGIPLLTVLVCEDAIPRHTHPKLRYPDTLTQISPIPTPRRHNLEEGRMCSRTYEDKSPVGENLEIALVKG